VSSAAARSFQNPESVAGQFTPAGVVHDGAPHQLNWLLRPSVHRKPPMMNSGEGDPRRSNSGRPSRTNARFSFAPTSTLMLIPVVGRYSILTGGVWRRRPRNAPNCGAWMRARFDAAHLRATAAAGTSPTRLPCRRPSPGACNRHNKHRTAAPGRSPGRRDRPYWLNVDLRADQISVVLDHGA
jgi:hypothetical protein